MKKNTVIATMICFIAMQSFSQSLSDKTMSFFGVDFTKAKMVGAGFENSEDLKNKIAAWNALFKAEADKYDLYKPLRKDKIDFDFTEAEKRNGGINTAGMVSQSTYTITPDQAEAVAKNYGAGKTGLGCVFVVESFNKTQESGSIYVVFFDVASKKIILTRKMEEKPGGFGLKNYWAKVIKSTIDDCGSQYGKWLKGK
jgi:hypothetical protein